MSKRYQTRNRTNKNTETPSARKQRAEARANGRGSNQAYTSGARTAQPIVNSRGYTTSEREFMRNAWDQNQNVQTVTKSKTGRMSVDGKKAGGSTWTYTNRDMEGNLISQSGRNKLSSRRERDYDTRAGMNNISPKVIQAWLDKGMARIVDGRMVGEGGMVIRQKADGNYSMGLSVG